MSKTYPEWMGKMRGLTKEELNKFLSEPRVARLATLKDDNSPYIATVWFHYEDGNFFLGGRSKSAWVQYVKSHPRVALHIGKDESPFTRVLVEGKAQIVEGPSKISGRWLEVANRMATRYLGERGPDYLVPTLDRPRVWIKITPEKLTSWEGVEWHRRYM